MERIFDGGDPPTRADERPDRPPQMVAADIARQAPTGRLVLVVFAAGLAAIGAAWAIVEFAFTHLP
jgi:hypothetical protein